MAAALFRRGTGLCIRCVHRELCRLVWRPQTALLSTKASDRKQPRRTHIKKAKPQPALDVAKLLEQLYSQRRPGTVSPVGKARPAKASSTPLSSLTAAPVGPPKVAAIRDPVEAKVDAPAEVAQNKNTDSGGIDVSHTAKDVPLSEITKDSPAEEDSFSFETRAAVDEGPVEPNIKTLDLAAETISTDSHVVNISQAAASETFLETSTGSLVDTKEDSPAQKTLNESTDSGPMSLSSSVEEEPLIETTTAEPTGKVSTLPQEALENETVADTAAPAVQNNSTESVSLSTSEPSEETITGPALETGTSPQETFVSGAAVTDFPSETKVNEAVDCAAQSVQTKVADAGSLSISQTEAGSSIETEIEASIEASTFVLETAEINLDVTKGPEETTIENVADIAAKAVETNSPDSGVVHISVNAKEEPLIEITTEPVVEARASPESGAELSESVVEPISESKAADNLSHITLFQNVQESAPITLENKVDSIIKSSSGDGAVAEEVEKSEQMTLESVTLHGVRVQVESFETEELTQTNAFLDGKAEQELQEILVQAGSGAEGGAVAETENSSETEDEGKNLSEVLSKWDSLSEELQQLEGESGTLVKEFLCHVPTAISKTPDETPDQLPGANKDPVLTQEKEIEAEAMTLESVSLANVKAEVRGLDTEVLLETRNELEKEAEVLAEREKMELSIKEEEEEDAVFDGITEADLLSLDSISEATDAIEAETSVILEAMFGSEQGQRQQPETVLDQELEQQDGPISQKAEKESGEQEKGSLEAMTLESVTLAEVEASLGTLESEYLSETSNYLEKEAEVLAKEEEVAGEKEVEPEEATEALNIESLSLIEDEVLQVDALVEELLFSVPGPVKGVTEGSIDQEAARANVSDEVVATATAATGSDDVETLAEVADDISASAPSEMLQGQEEEKVESAQAEDLEDVAEVGTQTDLDPVQRLFLEKIREYSNMRRLNGGPLKAKPDYEKHLSEETAKLQRLYGGGDLSSFPEFTFAEPEIDKESK